MLTPPPVLQVRHLVKEYRRPSAPWAPASVVRAVDDVSFEVETGETFGLVGESGCGKTTIARCILRLIAPTAGDIILQSRDLLSLDGPALRRARRAVQLVFQDPASALNPRLRASAIVEEPLAIHRVGTRADRRTRVAELFRLVGLDPSHMDRRPHEFSGGQRQRICLARALALEPALLVTDEPVSALDVSVQAQVINLLLDLQAQRHLAYLLIAHDLRLVRRICSRVAVMFRGQIVEMGDTEAVFGAPAHPYTRALLSAAPSAVPGAAARRLRWDPDGLPAGALLEVEPGRWARTTRPA